MGGHSRNPFAFRGAIERLIRSEGVFTLAASSASEQAVEVNELRHGVLTYALLGGLKAVDHGPLASKVIEPENAEGVVGVLEWFNYVGGHVPSLTKRYLGQAQEVRFHGEGVSFPLLPLAPDGKP